MLFEERINEYMRSEVKAIFYELTDSTNLRAREYALCNGVSEPVVFVAREQTAGRGRLGRSFMSREGGIYMRILMPAGDGADVTAITAMAAVKAARALSSTIGLEVGLKWVNDLYVNGKKLAGILTEGMFGENGKLAYYILGMGINVYKIEDFASVLPIATSIEDALCKKVDINLLAASLADALLSEVSSDEALSEYRRRSVVTGKELVVVGAEVSYPAVAEEILDDYSLLVRRLDNGERVRVFTGEVSVKL